eukprot:scaffold44979_cov31-Tisochrysis_lutea.AAC.4
MIAASEESPCCVCGLICAPRCCYPLNGIGGGRERSFRNHCEVHGTQSQFIVSPRSDLGSRRPMLSVGLQSDARGVLGHACWLGKPLGGLT